MQRVLHLKLDDILVTEFFGYQSSFPSTLYIETFPEKIYTGSGIIRLSGIKMPNVTLKSFLRRLKTNHNTI